MALIDGDEARKSDAIILLEGDGNSRCEQAVQLYLKGLAEKVVFSGNVNKPEQGSIPLLGLKDFLVKLGLLEKDLIFENRSLNTREQAVEIVKLCQEMGWKKIILVASHYHQYRAFLTFLKVTLENKEDIIIYNAPARGLAWFKETGYGQRVDLLEKEFAKIEQYYANFHIASFEEALEYQKWKEQQA